MAIQTNGQNNRTGWWVAAILAGCMTTGGASYLTFGQSATQKLAVLEAAKQAVDKKNDEQDDIMKQLAENEKKITELLVRADERLKAIENARK